MKNFCKLVSLFVLVATFGFVGCKENSGSVDDTMKVVLESDQISLDGNGGVYSIGYSLVNGINGIDIVAESDVRWLKNFRTAQSRIIFDYDKNYTSSQREALIAVRYPGLSMQTIKVVQEASDVMTFTMELCDIKTTSCSTKIYPSDDEVPYIVYMAEMDYLLACGITDAEALFRDDYDAFTKWAMQYNPSSLKEFMYYNSMYFVGESYITWEGMVPDKEYVVYAYAIEFNDDGSDYVLASPITHDIIILPTHSFADITFDVDITVTGPRAEYSFEPLDWEGKYYIDIYAEGDYMYLAEGETPDLNYCKQVANNWLSMINIYMQSGYSAEQLMEMMCLQGPDSYGEDRLSDTAYCMLFYGIEMVDGLPQVVTKPYVAHFRTEVVGASDMTIDIKVENCYVRVADIVITPSTDEPYVATFVEKSALPFTDPDELLAWLSSFNIDTYRGEVVSKVTTLAPDTEYTVLAYGRYGGVVTTSLFRYDFRTEPESECQNAVLGLTHGGPYSLVELEEAMPDTYYKYGMFESYGWYAMWAELQTAAEGNVFINIYDAEDLIRYDLADIEADLRATPAVDGSACFFSGENGDLYILCGIAMDYKGNFSEMWVSDPFSYSLTESSKRPVSEFLDKLGLTPEAQAKRKGCSEEVDLRLKL